MPMAQKECDEARVKQMSDQNDFRIADQAGITAFGKRVYGDLPLE